MCTGISPAPQSPTHHSDSVDSLPSPGYVRIGGRRDRQSGSNRESGLEEQGEEEEELGGEEGTLLVGMTGPWRVSLIVTGRK